MHFPGVSRWLEVSHSLQLMLSDLMPQMEAEVGDLWATKNAFLQVHLDAVVYKQKDYVVEKLQVFLVTFGMQQKTVEVDKYVVDALHHLYH